jgi:hypothetical protein
MCVLQNSAFLVERAPVKKPADQVMASPATWTAVVAKPDIRAKSGLHPTFSSLARSTIVRNPPIRVAGP